MEITNTAHGIRTHCHHIQFAALQRHDQLLGFDEHDLGGVQANDDTVLGTYALCVEGEGIYSYIRGVFPCHINLA